MSFFGKNIKKIRSVKHMSQLDFAALFDLKRGTLGAYEEGRSEPKIDTIIKVSQHFKISTDQLLTGELTVNQLLNFSTDIHDGVTKLTESNNISIPLLNDANINSILVESWDSSVLDSATLVQLPVESTTSIAIQYNPQISLQYTATTFLPSDILFASEKDIVDTKETNTYIVLYMKQLLMVDGILENGIIQSSSSPAINAQDCTKIWRVTAKLNASHKPQNTHSVIERLEALEKEVRLLKE